MGTDIRKKEDGRDPALGSWFMVWGLATLFFLYGLFMFSVVGDKGPPDWDFGVVEDTPGKSEYSTFPEPGSAIGEPEPQHVAGKPGSEPDDQGEERK